MATKTVTSLIDDLDGGPADGTTSFGYDGTNYEIDLSEKHGTALYESLAEFIEHARVISVPSNGKKTRANKTSSNGSSTNGEAGAIRAWALENGHEVSNRGRIPKPILEAYQAVHA